MTEQKKKPQAGEYWETRDGERRRIAADVPEHKMQPIMSVNKEFEWAAEVYGDLLCGFCF